MKLRRINKDNSVFFTLITLLLVPTGFYLSYLIYNEVPPSLGDNSQLITYGKPILVIRMLLLTNLFLPIMFIMICLNSTKKHIKLIFICLQLFSIGFGLINLRYSYYIITDKYIHYRCFIKNTVCTLSDVKNIQFKFIPAKNVKGQHYDSTCGVYITLNDETNFELNNDPKNFNFRGCDNFLKFDKNCINAEKNIDSTLANEHKDILKLYWGLNSNYILRNYTAN